MKKLIKAIVIIVIFFILWFSFSFWKNYQSQLEFCKIHYRLEKPSPSAKLLFQSKPELMKLYDELTLESWCKHKLKQELLLWFKLYFPFK